MQNLQSCSIFIRLVIIQGRSCIFHEFWNFIFLIKKQEEEERKRKRRRFYIRLWIRLSIFFLSFFYIGEKFLYPLFFLYWRKIIIEGDAFIIFFRNRLVLGTFSIHEMKERSRIMKQKLRTKTSSFEFRILRIIRFNLVPFSIFTWIIWLWIKIERKKERSSTFACYM